MLAILRIVTDFHHGLLRIAVASLQVFPEDFEDAGTALASCVQGGLSFQSICQNELRGSVFSCGNCQHKDVCGGGSIAQGRRTADQVVE